MGRLIMGVLMLAIAMLGCMGKADHASAPQEAAYAHCAEAVLGYSLVQDVVRHPRLGFPLLADSLRKWMEAEAQQKLEVDALLHKANPKAHPAAVPVKVDLHWEQASVTEARIVVQACTDGEDTKRLVSWLELMMERMREKEMQALQQLLLEQDYQMQDSLDQLHAEASMRSTQDPLWMDYLEQEREGERMARANEQLLDTTRKVAMLLHAAEADTGAKALAKMAEAERLLDWVEQRSGELGRETWQLQFGKGDVAEQLACDLRRRHGRHSTEMALSIPALQVKQAAHLLKSE